MRRRALIGQSEDNRLYIFDGAIHGKWGAIKFSSSSYFWWPNYYPRLNGHDMEYGFGNGSYYQGAYCNIPINFDNYEKIVVTFSGITYPGSATMSLSAVRHFGEYIVEDTRLSLVDGNANLFTRIPQGTQFPHTETFDIRDNVGTGYIGFDVYSEYGGAMSTRIEKMYLE